ncbi:MAG: acyl-CoA dehydrogenase family protein [Syntrophales bacterium]|nr:acyl-CoA dehydrogenase family protein [Syntrophales bacterium]
MDYQFSPEQVKRQQELAAFCRAEIAPRTQMLDRAPREEVGACMRENLRNLARGGWLAAGQQGDTVDLVEAYQAGEEIAKACPATFVSARASAFLCAGALRLFGTPEQKERYIPPLLQAEMVGALAYSEALAGSDLKAITTSACKDGDGWLLNGAKDIVVNAPIADIILVLACDNKSVSAEQGMSLFVIEKEAAGLDIGLPVETMGLRGVPIAAVSLSNCRPSGVLGGAAGQGYHQVQRLLTMGAVGIAALCVGIGSACMEIATCHAKTRASFGKPIGLHQDVGFKLADMFTITDLGRLLALRAAWAINTGEHEADILAACAKLFAGEAATKVVDWGMQIFAGHGYLAGTEMERLYRDAKFGEICEGTSEIQRAFIAKNELDRYGSLQSTPRA